MAELLWTVLLIGASSEETDVEKLQCTQTRPPTLLIKYEELKFDFILRYWSKWSVMTLPSMTSAVIVNVRDGWRKFLHSFMDEFVCVFIHLSGTGMFSEMSFIMYQCY